MSQLEIVNTIADYAILYCPFICIIMMAFIVTLWVFLKSYSLILDYRYRCMLRKYTYLSCTLKEHRDD